MMDAGSKTGQRREMFRHAVAFVPRETVDRAILPGAHINGSRVILAMIDAAAIDSSCRRRRSRRSIRKAH